MSEDHKHEFEEVYNGLKCKHCDLFYPDNGNYFAPLDDDISITGAEEWDDEEDDEDAEHHPFDCICETCLQNHPERDILYGDGNYFNWGKDGIENEDETE